MSALMPADHVKLVCLNGHEHLMAEIQAARIVHEPCVWCRAAMYRALWWEGEHLVSAMPPATPAPRSSAA